MYCMKLAEAKQQFINSWGRLGSEWGINRTMAQIHALLLVSDKPLCTEDVMEHLGVSRGNANMNLRELIGWDLIYKEHYQGDRKEYFRAEKDIWEVAKRIARERKRREIEPVMRELVQIQDIEDNKSAEAKEFVAMVKNIQNFTGKIDKTVDTMMKADENWFFGAILKLLK